MTPAEFRQGRLSMGLTQVQLAAVMGYSNQPKIAELEHMRTAIPPRAARLMEAYLQGYRPDDWPG